MSPEVCFSIPDAEFLPDTLPVKLDGPRRQIQQPRHLFVGHALFYEMGYMDLRGGKGQIFSGKRAGKWRDNGLEI